MAETGLTQINLWVPAAAVADFQRAAELARDHRHLSIGRLVDAVTGRLVGLRGPA